MKNKRAKFIKIQIDNKATDVDVYFSIYPKALKWQNDKFVVDNS